MDAHFHFLNPSLVGSALAEAWISPIRFEPGVGRLPERKSSTKQRGFISGEVMRRLDSRQGVGHNFATWTPPARRHTCPPPPPPDHLRCSPLLAPISSTILSSRCFSAPTPAPPPVRSSSSSNFISRSLETAPATAYTSMKETILY